MIQTHAAHVPSQSPEPRSLPAFFPASLFSPGEMQSLVAHGAPELRSQVHGRWFLCGDVSKEMYRVLKEPSRHELAIRVFGIETPLRARYGIVCHQIRGHVHRFLLPLYEPRVGDFLLAMRAGRVAVQFGRDGSLDGATLKNEAQLEPELLPLLGLASPVPGELARVVLGELPSVITETKQLVRFAVGPDSVEDVSVSVVLPTATLQKCLAQGAKK